jgi:hypothetical protein
MEKYIGHFIGQILCSLTDLPQSQNVAMTVLRAMESVFRYLAMAHRQTAQQSLGLTFAQQVRTLCI